jgi:dienelactone hydrolase
MKSRLLKILAGLFLTIGIGVLGAIYVFWPPHFAVETISFTTNVIPDSTNDKSVTITGILYTPKEASQPLASVVIAPSSGGVEQSREIYYAEQLTKAGLAVLIVDSFSARGIDNSLYDQSLLESWQVENDAWAGLRYLIKDPRFDPDRIAIMGGSKGGTVALDTALTVRRKWAAISDLSFAAHVAISPDCNWTNLSNLTTGAPILFLLAGRDDQTPIKPCLEKAERMRTAGNTSIETRVYRDAHHAWEELGRQPQYDPKVENYSNCRVWILDDGQMSDAASGKLIPEKEWHKWAAENCMKLGATCCGGSRRLKSKATLDIINFLCRNGLRSRSTEANRAGREGCKGRL